MEETNEIGNEVRVYNEKRENIRKSMDDLKSVASDLLVFNLKWNDLEDYLKSVEEKLDKRFKELVSKEMELQQRVVLSDLETKAEEKRKELDILRNQVKLCVAESKEEEIRLTQLQTQSSELIKTQGEIELKVKQLGKVKIDLEKHLGELSVEMKRLNLTRTRKRELDEEIYRKGLVLATVRDKTEECMKQQELLEKKLSSQKKLLDARSLEVSSKEKKLEEVRLDLDLTEHIVKSLHDEMEETCKEMTPKAKKLEEIEKLIEERSAHCESIKLLIEKHTEEFSCKEKKQQEKLSLINEKIRRCSGELESKRNDRDQVQSSITKLTVELKSKECELNTVKNKIQDFESEEAEQVRSGAVLVKRQIQLGLKEKNLNAREEKINDRYQQLKSMEQNLSTCITKYEERRAKRLSKFCQKGNTNQQDLPLLLHDHLKKCSQLDLDVISVLKLSSDPSKLVLESIKELHSTHQEKTGTNLDPLSVGRNAIYLLECLMSMSAKANTEVQGEAIEFLTGMKENALVKLEDPVEMLGFLHSLAVFSSAYTFDAEKVKNLFDATFLGKYTLRLCKSLGVSAPALVHNLLPFNDKPYEAPNSNSNDLSHNVQENVASSHLASRDASKDLYGSSSFSPYEVTGLRHINNPRNYVLSFVNDAIMATRTRGELSLSEPIVEILVPLLEELPRVVRPSDYLQPEARQVAQLWSFMLGANARKSPLEVWGFLHLIVAFGLVDLTKEQETLQFVLYVAHFRQAPRLCQALGLIFDIPYVVKQLIEERKYIPATRFIFYFKLMSMFPPMEFLKEEIINLRRSCKEKRRIESQAEERKLRDIIELIEEFNLEIDLPSDIIVKFMIPREAHCQNQCGVLSSVPFQPPVHMQAPPPVMQSSPCIFSHGSNQNIPTVFGVQLNPQVSYNMDQAGGSTQSSQQVGFKRPRVDARVDPRVPSSASRPYFNPTSGNGR